MKVTYEKKEIDAKEGTTVKEALKEEIEKSKYYICRMLGQNMLYKLSMYNVLY